MVDSLYSLGYGAREFASAEEFLTSDGSYDCIVTDIHMPGMSGLDLKYLLSSRRCQMPVIMITARADPELEIRVAARGAIGLLRKPFKAEALVDCLEGALRA